MNGKYGPGIRDSFYDTLSWKTNLGGNEVSTGEIMQEYLLQTLQILDYNFK